MVGHEPSVVSSTWSSPGRSSLAAVAGVTRPSTLDRRTVRFSDPAADSPGGIALPEMAGNSPTFPPPPPPLAIASFNYAALYPHL